jgi:hypothetical protein
MDYFYDGKDLLKPEKEKMEITEKGRTTEPLSSSKTRMDKRETYVSRCYRLFSTVRCTGINGRAE